ncbi:hypothetical protein GCM10009533_47140 [Saccharopolyspora spinosporotrichia]|uniref:Uncharacterized protein n=1 Tax=Saccharopolyspora erythraea TaxID=1836 RepID=A0ABN1DG29_SACER
MDSRESARGSADSDEKRLLDKESDVIFGLVADGPRVGVRDRRIRAVWSWSPRARLPALGPSTAEDADAGVPTDEQHYVPGDVPRVLARLGKALDAEVEGGPTYVFCEEGAEGPVAELPVIVSDNAGQRAAQRLVRPDDWSELVTGQRGEWAMAVHGGSRCRSASPRRPTTSPRRPDLDPRGLPRSSPRPGRRRGVGIARTAQQGGAVLQH